MADEDEKTDTEFMKRYGYTKKIECFVNKGYCKECDSTIVMSVSGYFDEFNIVRQAFCEELSEDNLGQKHIEYPKVELKEDSDGCYSLISKYITSKAEHEFQLYSENLISNNNHCRVTRYIYNHDTNCDFVILRNKDYNDLTSCPFLLMEYLKLDHFTIMYGEENDVFQIFTKEDGVMRFSISDFTRKYSLSEIPILQDVLESYQLSNLSN